MKINMMQNKIAHTLLRHIVTQQYQFAFFVVVNVHSTLPRCRVFNKNSVSWQSLPAIFNVNSLPTFLGNYLSLSRVFMCFTELKKKKINDVCVLFKHSNNLCSRGQDFKIFPETSCLWCLQVAPYIVNLRRKWWRMWSSLFWSLFCVCRYTITGYRYLLLGVCSFEWNKKRFRLSPGNVNKQNYRYLLVGVI